MLLNPAARHMLPIGGWSPTLSPITFTHHAAIPDIAAAIATAVTLHKKLIKHNEVWRPLDGGHTHTWAASRGCTRLPTTCHQGLLHCPMPCEHGTRKTTQCLKDPDWARCIHQLTISVHMGLHGHPPISATSCATESKPITTAEGFGSLGVHTLRFAGRGVLKLSLCTHLSLTPILAPY